MITSAPFDNWWHNAYGLDVKIVSPPHVVLALGMIGIRFGTLVMVLAEVNRATGQYRARLERILFFCFLFLLAMTVGIMQEDTFHFFMHGARFYLVIMLAAPIWFAAVSLASENRWAATIMTGAYTFLHICFMQILQLIPAVPKLGPVYQNLTHLVPPDFPLLLIVPAFVFDLVRRHITTLNRWTRATILGAASLTSFLAVQWPFANFLMSPASHNRFFATSNMPYFIPPNSHWARERLVPHRIHPPPIRHSHAPSPSRRHPDDPPRPKLGRLDAPPPPLAYSSYFCWISSNRGAHMSGLRGDEVGNGPHVQEKLTLPGAVAAA